MRKLMLGFGLSCGFAMPVMAQMSYMPLGNGAGDKVENMFTTANDDLNYHFHIVMNKDMGLDFSFSRTGQWDGKPGFTKALNTGEAQLKLYADSMKRFANSKRLDLSINIKGDQVVSRYQTSEEHNDLRMTQNGSLQAYKTGRDTLRIVQSFEREKIQGLVILPRSQYTFSVKELKDLAPYLHDEKWIDRTVAMIDSVMNVYKEKWKNPDANWHSLYVNYNPARTEAPVFIRKKAGTDSARMSSMLIINGSIGAALVRNTICPDVNVGAKIQFSGTSYASNFVKLSMNSFVRYEQDADKKFKAYSTSFLNAEFGVQTHNGNRFNPNFLFSMGLGYKLVTKEQLFRDPSMDKHMYKLFFNYSLSKNVIVQPEFISNLKRNERYNGWMGLTVNFQLF